MGNREGGDERRIFTQFRDRRQSAERIMQEKGVFMKIRWIAAVGIILLAAQVNAQENRELKSPKEKISYIIGMDLGKNFKKQSVEVDPDSLVRGLKDALSGAKSRLTEQEVREGDEGQAGGNEESRRRKE
jgi:hypothetical protein